MIKTTQVKATIDDTPTELEENVASAWLSTGAISITEYGNENTYYVNEFDKRFFCKNYPQQYGAV